jgi:hypothetical protein
VAIFHLKNKYEAILKKKSKIIIRLQGHVKIRSALEENENFESYIYRAPDLLGIENWFPT